MLLLLAACQLSAESYPARAATTVGLASTLAQLLLRVRSFEVEPEPRSGQVRPEDTTRGSRTPSKDLVQPVEVVGRHRLLEPRDPELGVAAGQAHGLLAGVAAVGVDEQLRLRPDRVPDRLGAARPRSRVLVGVADRSVPEDADGPCISSARSRSLPPTTS
jgi:hypothetical protein